jgi:predicted DNA-binding transcriptional regulator YafY
MSKSARLLTMLNLIRSKRAMTSSQLAAECQVSQRTVYRDVLSLAEAGVPIYYDKGYRLLNGAFLPPLNLTTHEYLALRTALQGTPLKALKSFRTEFASVMAKIDAVVSGQIAERVRKQQSRLLVSPRITAGGDSIDLTMRLLQQAVDSDSIIKINYRSISSGASVRRVNPYFLIFRGRAWYLLGYCHLRHELRVFRVDRIEKLTLTAERFERDHKLTPEEYFEWSWEVFTGNPVEVKLLLRGKAAAVISTGKRQPEEQIVKRRNGSVEYTATVAGIEEIRRWIIAFGGEVVVISPPELADAVRLTATDVLKNYR